MTNIEVYNKPEAFKYGWAAGFYDARSDDGLHYLSNILRFGPHATDHELFIEGYRAGRQARLGHGTSYLEPAARQFTAAA
ncbi:MAG: hypothetical protein LAO55_17375 [Acidobacteriia bacterium]|nr:hypothetical protein [Terriglobia bacterium]